MPIYYCMLPPVAIELAVLHAVLPDLRSFGPIFRANMGDTEILTRRIAELQLEHRDLDLVIETLAHDPTHDQLQIRRLKKRKLQIKDAIMLLQMQLTPDIPA